MRGEVDVSSRTIRIIPGLILCVAGICLIASPLAVAHALGRPHETSSQIINLRASWGGTIVGIGAFMMWLRAWKPTRRAMLGLVMWAMIGIGLARATGFVLDGHPDRLQWIWISAEAAIATACMVGLRRGETAHAKTSIQE